MSIKDTGTIENDHILLDLKNKMGYQDISKEFFMLKKELGGSSSINFSLKIRKKYTQNHIQNLKDEIKRYEDLIAFGQRLNILDE